MPPEEFNPRMGNIIQTGFSTSDSDDETFYLEKIGTYPGKLPYEIEHTVDVKADIYQDSSESNQELNKSQVLASTEDTKEIPVELGQQSLPPIEKEELIEDPELKPFNKSGLLEDEHGAIPYEKSGLIPKDISEPFERVGTIKDDIGPAYEKSGLSEIEEEPLEPDGIKTIWDIFEKEQSEFSEIETEIKEEKEPPVEESVSTESETEKSTIVVDEGSVIDFPAEIRISEYDENEFAKVIDEDFRNKILEDLERSKDKNTPEREIPPQDLIPTTEIEDLQKELLQERGEKIDDTKYIEVELTAINLPQPSKIIAEEIRQEPGYTIEAANQPKGKKDKKEKKKKNKSEAKPIADIQPEQLSKVEPPTIEEPSQVEEQQIVEQQIKEQTSEEKKKKLALVFWLAFAGLFTFLLVVFFILKPLWFTQVFDSKKRIESQKATTQDVKELERVDKIQGTLQKTPQESTTSPTFIEKPKAPKQLTQQVAKIVQKETSKEASKPKTEVQPEITRSDLKESLKPRLTTPKATFAWKIRQESAPVIEIIPQREYSVEVFTTYDPDEANYLLNLLNQKQISAYIKVQVIKNANLYKVRIGSFKSLDDAKEFAKQFGFKNVWIDRIR